MAVQTTGDEFKRVELIWHVSGARERAPAAQLSGCRKCTKEKRLTGAFLCMAQMIKGSRRW